MECTTDLKKTRKALGLTQKEAASYLGISLRSYLSYENGPDYGSRLKRAYLEEKMKELALVDEEHGVLSLEEIARGVKEVLGRHGDCYCYLFGSYAKRKAKGDSDVDLLVSAPVSGIEFYRLNEELRERLHKKVDLLTLTQVTGNQELLDEILKDGIKIYG